jgi:PAS domain S-box-containing protein
VQKKQPLHWIIDTAPIFLGLFALIGGVSKEKVLELNKKLIQTEKNTQDKFEIIFKDANFGVLIFNWNSQKFERMNSCFLNMIGYTYNELSQIGIEAISDPNDLAMERKHFRRMLKDKHSIQYNKRFIHKNGNVIWTKLTQSVIRDESNKPIFVLTIIDDITSSIETEKFLLEAKNKADEASKAKSMFLANMSHEIRTPMNGILGMSQILSETNLDLNQKNIIRTIKTSGDSLLHILNDILDYSKIESGKIELEFISFSLKELIEELANFFSTQIQNKKIEFHLSIQNEIPNLILGDPTRLRQILLNILSNAIKFTPQEGKIQFQIHLNEITNSKAIIFFSVEDNGIGIESEKIKQLFESFTQADVSMNRKYGGTGLGLAITKKLVDLMNGKIQIESILEKGTSFKIEIPFEITERLDLVNEIQSNQKLDFSNLKILLAEDNEINQKVAAKFFQNLKLNFEIAENGKKVLELLEHRVFDVIFMDIQMPELDGIQTTKLIRSNIEIFQPYIIAMTANAMIGDKEECLSAGMNEYISKPFKQEEISNKLNQFLNSKSIV